jgi:hypothetical protein
VESRAMTARSVPRERGRADMTLRTAQRFATAAALVAILFLAAAPAQARDLGPAPGAWHWIQDLWTKGVSFFWSWAEPSSADRPNDLQKGGVGSPPSGGPTSLPSCDSCVDQGPGSDPNG